MTSKKLKPLFRRQFLEDQVIFKEGDAAGDAFLIEEGEVKIYREHDGMTTDIVTLGPGEIFGEMALTKLPSQRNATACAVQKTLLTIITYDNLRQKLEKTDPLIKALFHMFIKRLDQSNNRDVTETPE